MSCKREYLRAKIESPCLIDLRDSIYRVFLGNISLGGALIRVGDESPGPIGIGDSIGLMLCSNPRLCPAKYRIGLSYPE